MLLATSVYLNSLPILRDEIGQRLAGRGTVTFDSQLALRAQVQQEVLAFFKQNRSVYRVIHFGFLEKTCPICQAVLPGEHVELVNAATGKSTMLPMLVFHALTSHHQGTLTEEDLDLGGNVRARRELSVNVGDLLAALKDSTATPDVLAEIAALQGASEKAGV